MLIMISSNKSHQPCGADDRKKKETKRWGNKISKEWFIKSYFKKSETLDIFVENNGEQHATSREDEVHQNISENHGEESRHGPENMRVVNEDELKEKKSNENKNKVKRVVLVRNLVILVRDLCL